MSEHPSVPTTPPAVNILEPAIRVLMMPKDTNALGTIFGGIILSYIDQAGAVGGAPHGRRPPGHRGDARGRVPPPGLRRRPGQLLRRDRAGRQHLDHRPRRGRGRAAPRPTPAAGEGDRGRAWSTCTSTTRAGPSRCRIRRRAAVERSERPRMRSTHDPRPARAANARRGGQIEVITGGMFSGKSEELVRRLRRARHRPPAGPGLQAARRRAPRRGPPGHPRPARARRPRGGRLRRAALACSSADVEVVGIDEAQFFDDGLAELVDASSPTAACA